MSMDREGFKVSGVGGASHFQEYDTSQYCVSSCLPCPSIQYHCRCFYVIFCGENGMGSTCGEESLSLMLHLAWVEAMKG